MVLNGCGKWEEMEKHEEQIRRQLLYMGSAALFYQRNLLKKFANGVTVSFKWLIA